MVKIKEGQLLKINHSRKGKFLAKAREDFDTSFSGFYPLIVMSESVEGLASVWVKGEAIACNSKLCSSIEKIESEDEW